MKFDTVTKFRAGRDKFIAQMNEITRRAKSGMLTKAEANEYLAIAKEGQSLGPKLDGVEKMIRAAESALGTTLGGLEGLGILPIVAPAVIITAIIAVSFLLDRFLTRSSEFLNRSDFIKQRVAQGVPADQALNEYAKNRPDDGGIFGDMSKLVWPIAIAVGGALLLK